MSRKTVSRLIANYSLQEGASRYANLTDDTLDESLASILHKFCNCSIRRMKRFLLGQEISVQWCRGRESLWRTDPTGLLLRTPLFNIVNRRHYSVPSPRLLLHLEGNHKFYSWEFVIYGCGDGYSRLVMFLKCGINNRAVTVLY